MGNNFRILGAGIVSCCLLWMHIERNFIAGFIMIFWLILVLTDMLNEWIDNLHNHLDSIQNDIKGLDKKIKRLRK